MDSLPTDILQKIIKYNNLIDIYKLKQTNKTLYSKIPKVPYLNLDAYSKTIDLFYKKIFKEVKPRAIWLRDKLPILSIYCRMKLDIDYVNYDILYALAMNNHADEFCRLYNSNKQNNISIENKMELMYYIIQCRSSIKMAMILLKDKEFDINKYSKRKIPVGADIRIEQLNFYIYKYGNFEFIKILSQSGYFNKFKPVFKLRHVNQDTSYKNVKSILKKIKIPISLRLDELVQADYKIFKYLYGQLNYQNNSDINKELFLKACRNYPNIVEFIINKVDKTTINKGLIKTTKGPIFTHEKDYSIKIAKFLIDNGANINYDFDKVLFKAIKNENINLVKFLLKNGANIHAKNDMALNMAIGFRHPMELIELLLKYGANPRAKDSRALHTALRRYRCPELIELLIEHGANIHTKNNKAVHVICRNYEEPYCGEILDILLEHGAKVDIEAIKMANKLGSDSYQGIELMNTLVKELATKNYIII